MTIDIREKTITRILYAMVMIVSAYLTIHTLEVSALLGNNPRSSIIPMVNGTSEKPYVYRLLLPQVAKFFTLITPQAIQDTVERFTQYQYPIFIVILGMYVALLIYALTLRQLSVFCFPESRYTAWATAFFGLLVLIPFIDGNTKLYDFPALAFSAICLFALLNKRWGYYLLAFTLGCLNKETIILQTVLFVMLYRRTLDRRLFARLLGLQLGIFSISIAVIHYLFFLNGGAVYFHPWAITKWLFADLHNSIHLIAIIMLLQLIMGRWHEIPPMLRQYLWVAAGSVAIYCIFGYPNEYRVFFDAFPGLTVIAGYTLLRPLEKARLEVA